MNKIIIQYIEKLNESDIQTASGILEKFCQSNAIDNINWPDLYSYSPTTFFYIARSKSSIFIKFKVVEENIKAIYSKDQNPVYEDSCVEFFCKKIKSKSYMNFEFNCIGTCIATKRKGKYIDIIPFGANQLNTIERFSSLGSHPFSQKQGTYEWELCVKIPYLLLEIDPDNLPEKLLGNFYKCADITSKPHYVSWNPISTESPNFHCQEFFGLLSFCK